MARWLRVVTVSMEREGCKERNLESAMNLLEQASWERPDLVCLPEIFTGLGMDIKDWFSTAETLYDETVQKLSTYARNHNCYVVCPIVLKDKGKVFNTTILIDRNGQVLGYYPKMFPTIGELKQGITPGNEVPVFETDFGRVGFAICFDLNFPEVAQNLKINRAELVCFVSMYPGGKQLQAWALEYGFWMVTAIAGPNSIIVNPIGRIVATTQLKYQAILSYRINLDCFVGHLDYNYEKLKDLKRCYGVDAEIEITQPEARFLLTCHRSDMSVWDWVQEFKLESLDEYFARARRERARFLDI